ncbi:MAG: DNA primase [Bacilli bacterium]|nr:DNA primase [Bacilli bacterium]
MAQLTNEEINKIQKSADIVEIIGSYIDLVKKGKNYFAVCPFHDDHTPSMSVSKERGIYSCFTCHATGNVFKFIQDYENVSFLEAVKIVAEKSGIELDLDFKESSKYDSMYDAYELAIKYYQNNLKSSLGHNAHKYLNDRSLSDEIIDEFEIGYASKEMDTLTKLLIAKGYDEETLINSGLINRGKSLYDLFRDRITFPIHNANGKPVAFSARIYEKKDDEAKYINTKETHIFKKGEILFNFHRARNEAKKLKKIILVEGQMDAIRVYASGIKNVVATMGTALTDYHVNLLKRLNVDIVLCFDADSAGEKATIAAGELLQKYGVTPHVCRLSMEKDPDEYIIKHGVDSFRNLIEHSMTFFEFKKKTFSNGKNLTKAEDISKYINSILEELKKSNDDILIEATINDLSKEYNISKDTLIKKFKSLDIKPYVSVKNKEEYKLKEKRKNLNNELCEKLIFYMISDTKYIRLYQQELSYLPIDKYAEIASSVLAFYLKYNYINMADFITEERDSKYINDILEILDSNINLELIDNDFVGFIEKIKEIQKKNKIDEEISTIKKTTDINEQLNLLDKLIKTKKDV